MEKITLATAHLKEWKQFRKSRIIMRECYAATVYHFNSIVSENFPLFFACNSICSTNIVSIHIQTIQIQIHFYCQNRRNSVGLAEFEAHSHTFFYILFKEYLIQSFRRTSSPWTSLFETELCLKDTQINIVVIKQLLHLNHASNWDSLFGHIFCFTLRTLRMCESSEVRNVVNIYWLYIDCVYRKCVVGYVFLLLLLLNGLPCFNHTFYSLIINCFYFRKNSQWPYSIIWRDYDWVGDVWMAKVRVTTMTRNEL